MGRDWQHGKFPAFRDECVRSRGETGRMDGSAHPTVSMARGFLRHGLRTAAMLPLTALFVGFVVYAGAVLHARPGGSASADDSHILSSRPDHSTAPVTQPAPIVVVRASPSQYAMVFIARTTEQAETWSRHILSANAIAEVKGLPPLGDRVELVASPSRESAIREGIYIENQLRFAHGMPALRIVDMGD